VLHCFFGFPVGVVRVVAVVLGFAGLSGVDSLLLVGFLVNRDTSHARGPVLVKLVRSNIANLAIFADSGFKVDHGIGSELVEGVHGF